MSELTPCNFCDLQRLKREAKAAKKVVSLRGDRGGIAAYVHCPNINLDALNESECGKLRRIWFMELTDHCVC